jgi:hypothetical protein
MTHQIAHVLVVSLCQLDNVGTLLLFEPLPVSGHMAM